MFVYENFRKMFASYGYTFEEIGEAMGYTFRDWDLSIYPYRRDIPSPPVFKKDNSKVRDIG